MNLKALVQEKKVALVREVSFTMGLVLIDVIPDVHLRLFRAFDA